MFDLIYAGSLQDDLVGRTNSRQFLKGLSGSGAGTCSGGVSQRRPRPSSLTFIPSSRVALRPPPAVVFLLHPTGLEDGKFRPLQTGSHCCLLTVFWSLSTSGTLALGPVTYDILLFPWCSSQNPRHTHTHAGTYTRAHAHTQGTMPCCGCWRPWPGGKFFATVPTRKRKNGKQILRMHSGNVRITPAGGHFNESG